ncbi:MAG TPA: hypothetical protein VIL55_00630 [Naasia sp.]|jgi:hypothetical protein
MTGIDEVVQTAPASERRTFRWLWVALTAVGLLLLAAVLLPGFPVAIMIAYVMVVGGAVYGVIAIPIISWRWVTVPRTAVQIPEGGSPDPADVAEFRTGPQRYTFLLNVVLAVNLVVAAGILMAGSLDPSSDSTGLLLLCGVVAEAFGIPLIAANAVWAYRRRYIAHEHRALEVRTGAHRLILANRILSYVVWVAYVGAAIVIWSQQGAF